MSPDRFPWTALHEARRHEPALRVPFVIEGRRVGSVALKHLPLLKLHQPKLALMHDRVEWRGPPATRDADFATVNRALHEAGAIVGWRDEPYAVVERPGQQVLARIERAASRFWGTLTLGAHCNGYMADGSGRPTRLWIARRSFTKPTDPGLFDNLVGGGVPADQSPWDCLVREGWEEAGLAPEIMRQARPGRVVELLRDIPEGLQHEWLFVHDLALPEGLQPVNQDGEVAELHCLAIQEALALASTDRMTVDASLATLDFALRHGLAGPGQPALRQAFERLLAPQE